MEARGQQDLWKRQKPEVLTALREQAIIQSVESSNRIEGVTVPANRLRPLVMGGIKPRDRSEEELSGYRRALDWIFSRKRSVSITPRLFQHLHGLAQRGAGDAGEWKNQNSEIIEILSGGERRVRFIPTAAKDTPGAMDLLCATYQDALERTPPLITIATFVFDLLCIHPFRDGNGRISRLATTLLLQVHGFDVGRYISLERLVEESKEEYYRVLGLCSQRWHEDKNEIIPWWNYFLGIVRDAYEEFQKHIELIEARPAKSDFVRRIVLSQEGDFTLADIVAQSPPASRQLVKKVLAQLQADGQVRLRGRGRGARWKVAK